MALIFCPECELQVSDKAFACPHCGLPMKGMEEAIAKAKRKKRYSRQMKLPNGFGRISKIKGQNLRNQYRVMVTVGKDSHGRPIGKLLKPQAYFPSYNDAYIALVEYQKNPYDLDVDITAKQLYDEWSSKYFETLASDSSIRTVTSAWKYCSSIYDMRVKDLKARHIKGCIDDGTIIEKGKVKRPSAGTKERIKSLFNLMLDYAVEYEIVDRNYARTFNLSSDVVNELATPKNPHLSFTAAEMKTLWDNVERVPYVDLVLIQCYSGWRPQELGQIRLDRVDLDLGIFTGGMKTENGINRVVPIHPVIKDLVKKWYDHAVELNSEYLFNCNDSITHVGNMKLTYDKYRYRFISVITQLELNPDHRPHDPRKQFSTMAKKAKLDEYAIKYIMGHAITDLTERVYTDREITWLIDEMQKIK